MLCFVGLASSKATLYRALERHGIRTHPCPDCHPASMSGYSPLAAARSPQLVPLPVPAAPVAGEALASFIGRLAAVNHATTANTCLRSVGELEITRKISAAAACCSRASASSRRSSSTD